MTEPAIELVLEETDDLLTYTGIGGAVGYSLVVTKRNDVVEVHQIIPIARATETWQQLRDRLEPAL